MISASGISLAYGRRVALAPLNLELDAGDRLAVLGPNGAGKTSLLRILATAVRPSTGELVVAGQRDRQAIRARVGYLGHQPAVYPALSGFENLLFFARLHGLGRDEARLALERAGVAHAADRPAGELSRGLQQRLALARSLVHDPQVWILDEPDASLDEDGCALLPELAQGRTVVLATHDRDLALRLGRRSLRLREGRVEAPSAAEAAQ
ncbi:MAG TPA: heme ABC exporter ATP-binding protein CcmA [Candidatus Dormibacteraeota bacterium]